MGHTAIEIDSPETWEILCALEPHFTELDYEFNKGFFVVINHEEAPWAVMSPQTVGVNFDHIEPGNRIKLVHLSSKK